MLLIAQTVSHLCWTFSAVVNVSTQLLDKYSKLFILTSGPNGEWVVFLSNANYIYVHKTRYFQVKS